MEKNSRIDEMYYGILDTPRGWTYEYVLKTAKNVGNMLLNPPNYSQYSEIFFIQPAHFGYQNFWFFSQNLEESIALKIPFRITNRKITPIFSLQNLILQIKNFKKVWATFQDLKRIRSRWKGEDNDRAVETDWIKLGFSVSVFFSFRFWKSNFPKFFQQNMPIFPNFLKDFHKRGCCFRRRDRLLSWPSVWFGSGLVLFLFVNFG